MVVEKPNNNNLNEDTAKDLSVNSNMEFNNEDTIRLKDFGSLKGAIPKDTRVVTPDDTIRLRDIQYLKGATEKDITREATPEDNIETTPENTMGAAPENLKVSIFQFASSPPISHILSMLLSK